MESIGELGYIWSGKPWQTLNLISTNDPASADWNLLDYVAAGRVSGGGITTVLPLKRASAEGTGADDRSIAQQRRIQCEHP